MAKKKKKDKKNKDFTRISINSFFNPEASYLDVSLSQVNLIHPTNISSSGNQFEVVVREFFKQKLPNKYYISNGHIIDRELKTSPQLDIIIADNFKTPILYTTIDKNEYLTYESIYAYAEVKTSWNKKYISDFITTRERLLKFLNRVDVDPSYIDTGGKGIHLDIPTTTNTKKNPLLAFLFIGRSQKFKFSDITDVYENTDWRFLPNILCLFDKGLIVNVNKESLDRGIFKINLYPEFISDQSTNEWVLLSYDKKQSTLGTLYYIILEHLNTCVLGQADMLSYMQQIFEIRTDNIEFLKDHR